MAKAKKTSKKVVLAAGQVSIFEEYIVKADGDLSVDWVLITDPTHERYDPNKSDEAIDTLVTCGVLNLDSLGYSVVLKGKGDISPVHPIGKVTSFSTPAYARKYAEAVVALKKAQGFKPGDLAYRICH